MVLPYLRVDPAFIPGLCQPCPIRQKPVLDDSTFSSASAPHSSHLVSRASENFCSFSFRVLHDLHSYS